MVSEFEFINKIKTNFSLDKVGDDCAVLPKDGTTDMLLTADMLVEDVDFRLAWTTPEFLGHKALAVSLSDIAAMGGTPTFSLLSLAVPERLWKIDLLDRFYKGWHELAAEHNIELIGGDISKTQDKLVIDSTVIGEVPREKAILRSGAKPGDILFVTGYVGGAAAGLLQLESGVRFDDQLSAPLKHLLFRQLQPLPQVRTANMLRERGLASAMLDISDGLSSDLAQLINASGVGSIIDLEKLPIDPAISSLDLSEEQRLDLALNGGEDFELLFAVDQNFFSAVQDLGFHHIGEINANIGIIELRAAGKSANLTPKGYRHF
ncbi:MAG: thiamine-phosphate kinase [Pyrinomonadaceae bacterium]